MKILIFMLLFLIVSGLILVNNNDLHLADKEDLKIFSELYSGWFSQVYSNVFSITGHVSKLSWFPK